jgi:hypothetical protein
VVACGRIELDQGVHPDDEAEPLAALRPVFLPNAGAVLGWATVRHGATGRLPDWHVGRTAAADGNILVAPAFSITFARQTICDSFPAVGMALA